MRCLALGNMSKIVDSLIISLTRSLRRGLIGSLSTEDLKLLADAVLEPESFCLVENLVVSVVAPNNNPLGDMNTHKRQQHVHLQRNKGELSFPRDPCSSAFRFIDVCWPTHFTLLSNSFLI